MNWKVLMHYVLKDSHAAEGAIAPKEEFAQERAPLKDYRQSIM